MANISKGKSSCPKDIVPYSTHQFVGKKTGTQVLGWDYSTFVFDINNDSVDVIFSDNGFSASSSIGAGDMNTLIDKIINDFFYGNFVANSGNTTQLSATVSGSFLYFTVTGPVNNNFQMTIRNSNSGVWGDGAEDPDSDGLGGRPPSLFTIAGTGGKCEIIELGARDFDCETDEVFFIGGGATSITVDGTVLGWSEPEGVQWNNIIFDNRSFRIQIDVETDGLGYATLGPIIASYATFSDMIDEMNNMLATYGSSFRLIGGIGGDRIFMTQLDGTIIVGDSDPYLSANGYNNLMLDIMDSVTSSDWLIKGRNPKEFSVSNVEAGGGGSGMFRGKIPCSSAFNLPVPKVILENFDTVTGFIYKEVEHYDRTSNTVGGTFTLKRFPSVIAQGITQSMIDAGVMVEMLMYKSGGQGWRGQAASGFIVPSPFIGGVNPLDNRSSRGGVPIHSINSGFGNVLVNGDRPNHFSVTSPFQKIDVTQYLYNRFSFTNVPYNDQSGIAQSIQILVPSSKTKKHHWKSLTSKVGYAPWYRPLYVKFRYVIWDDKNNQFIEGPLSPTVKIAYSHHPFNYDPIASGVNGIPCVQINPLLDINEMQCYIESNL